MHPRVKRRVAVILFAAFISVSALAAPENRRESGDWLVRQIDRIVHQLMKIFVPLPFDDPVLNPPKP